MIASCRLDQRILEHYDNHRILYGTHEIQFRSFGSTTRAAIRLLSCGHIT